MSTEKSIVERLEALEKQNRLMKRIGAAVIVIAVSMLLMGQAAATRTVEANAFILKDRAGKVRAEWSFSSSGQPELFMRDAKGQERVVLGLNYYGQPDISVFDANGKERITVDMSSDGQPELGVMDTKGNVTWKAP